MSFTSSKLESNHGKDKGNPIVTATSSAPFADDEASVEERDSRPRLAISLQSTSPRSYDTFSAVPTDFFLDENERRTSSELGSADILIFKGSTKNWKSKWQTIWGHNKGIVLVIVSQFIGALMNLATRLLETAGNGHEMHTFEILFVRMSITVLLSSGYMWLADIEHFPLGNKEVRKLLLLRGFGGFLGVWGLYYSLQYLSLAESIVITFLAPTVACWACSILIHEPFPRKEQLAGLIALIGVVLIARPQAFFSGTADPIPIEDRPDRESHRTNSTRSVGIGGLEDVTPGQRLNAIAASLLGVGGAVISYVSIRWIGKRAHPLILVNYFAACTTSISAIALLAVPGITFRLPSSFREWGFLSFLGVCGFVQKLLFTAGMQHEKSSRATNMVYTHMLFALAFDKIVWNSSPAGLSIVGSILILGSTIYVAAQNDNANNTKIAGKRDDEESRLVVGEGHEGNEESSQRETGPSTGLGKAPSRTTRT